MDVRTNVFDNRRPTSLRNFPSKKIQKLRLFKNKSVPYVDENLLNALGKKNFPTNSPECLQPEITTPKLSTSTSASMEVPAGVRCSTPQGAGTIQAQTFPPTGRGTTPRGSSSSTSSGQGVGATPRSLSLASISSEGSAESHMVEQSDIVALSAYVKSFKEALGKLRKIFNPERDKTESLKVSSHEKLGEVLRILQAILVKYSPIQHSELLSAASHLITHVNGFNYEDESADNADFLESIDHLALAFSSRVSEYLMGDIDAPSAVNSSSPSSRAKSCDSISADGDGTAEKPSSRLSDVSGPLSDGSSVDSLLSVKDTDSPISADLDELLYLHDKGVELALHRAKSWSKYAKDIITYIEKRCQLGMDYARNQTKLAAAIRPMLKEESFLPFQSIYCTALDHDIEISAALTNTCSLLQNKFIEPLSVKRTEHEQMRKNLKDSWYKEMKRFTDSVNSLKRAKMLYVQKNQDLIKVQDNIIKAISSEHQDKLEKKKEELIQKIKDSTSAYSTAVLEANIQHTSLMTAKRKVVRSARELLLQADHTLKAVTTAYFQLQQSFLAYQPLQFQTLYESTILYESGSQYREFIKRIGPSSVKEIISYPFEFESFTQAETSVEEIQKHIGSDTDSLGSSRSAKSADVSPTSSPLPQGRRIGHQFSSGDELDVDGENDATFLRRQFMSKAADTHSFRKLKTPSRCRECDSYVYFHGFECNECGLGCHKKCLESLAIQCGHKRLPRKLTTFGVDLQQHLQETYAQVPHLIVKCLTEIDARGTNIKGIYRVSGLKSKVEKLCQAFENGPQLVDLTDQHPNVIANVLKLYLRQLPEPLLTFRLYSEFIKIAKDFPTNGGQEPAGAVVPLRELIKRLPPHHLFCLRALMIHLSKVAAQSEMNNMPPSNLGIVFGPTLLRTSDGSASLSSLVDTVHQTRVIELLVINAVEIFSFIDNWLPKTVKMHHADIYGSDVTQPNVTTLSGSSSSSSTSSIYSSGMSATKSKLEDYKSVPLRQGSTQSNSSLITINPTINVSKSEVSGKLTTDGGKQAKTESESESIIPGWNDKDSPAQFRRKAQQSIRLTQPESAATTIVKTSLKDYVGLEMAALQEQRQNSLEMANPVKPKPTMRDNTGSASRSVDGNFFEKLGDSTESLSAGKFPIKKEQAAPKKDMQVPLIKSAKKDDKLSQASGIGSEKIIQIQPAIDQSVHLPEHRSQIAAVRPDERNEQVVPSSQQVLYQKPNIQQPQHHQVQIQHIQKHRVEPIQIQSSSSSVKGSEIDVRTVINRSKDITSDVSKTQDLLASQVSLNRKKELKPHPPASHSDLSLKQPIVTKTSQAPEQRDGLDLSKITGQAINDITGKIEILAPTKPQRGKKPRETEIVVEVKTAQKRGGIITSSDAALTRKVRATTTSAMSKTSSELTITPKIPRNIEQDMMFTGAETYLTRENMPLGMTTISEDPKDLIKEDLIVGTEVTQRFKDSPFSASADSSYDLGTEGSLSSMETTDESTSASGVSYSQQLSDICCSGEEKNSPGFSDEYDVGRSATHSSYSQDIPYTSPTFILKRSTYKEYESKKIVKTTVTRPKFPDYMAKSRETVTKSHKLPFSDL